MALDLFLPDMGYTSLAGLCLQETGATNFLWTDKDGTAHAFYDLADAQTAIGKFLEWKREGLIDIKSDVDDSGYPTILINTVSNSMYSYNLTSYTYNAFSEPDVQYPSVSMVAIAGSNTDATEFVRFMDWMQDIEHYKYMEYGVQDVDYEWDGRYITDNGISDYYKAYSRLYFSRSDFNFQLFDYSTHASVGALTESVAEETTQSPLSWQTRYELGKKLNSDSEYQNFVSSANKTMLSLFNSLYVTDDTTKQAQKIQEAFETIQKVPGADTAADLVNAALKN